MVSNPPINRSGRVGPLLVPIALVAVVSVVIAVWAGLGRIGAVGGAPMMSMHGPLMVFGFLGTVISIERAVGLRRQIGWLTPLLSAVGAGAILIGQPQVGAAILIFAGVGLVGLYVASGKIAGYETHTIVMGLGAVAYVIGVTGLVIGLPVREAVPAMVGFLVLTIVGERIELARFGPSRNPGWLRVVVGSSLGMVIALSLVQAGVDVATRIVGFFLLALAIASAYGDIARRTIRMEGVTRFMAAALLAGYLWLAVGGITWIITPLLPGAVGYDIGLHAVFIGFVFSMIFAHAAVIVPAVTGLDLPYHPTWWVALGLLHLSLLARILGRLIESDLYVWGGVGNATSFALFAALAIRSAVRQRRREA